MYNVRKVQVVSKSKLVQKKKKTLFFFLFYKKKNARKIQETDTTFYRLLIVHTIMNILLVCILAALGYVLYLKQGLQDSTDEQIEVSGDETRNRLSWFLLIQMNRTNGKWFQTS